METDPNAAQRDFWSGPVGETWVRLEAALEAVHGPFIPPLLAAADIRLGDRVLDIGCGAGATTRAAALQAGPGGRVAGLDISATMLDGARALPVAAAAAPIDWVLDDAQTRDFGAARFDVLLSRMGVMFFDDPEAAFANLLTAAAPGARYAAICWRRGADAAWFTLAYAALEEVFGPQPPADADAPGPMAFGDAERVTGIMAAAGWHGAAAEKLPVTLRPGGGLDEAVEAMTKVGPVSRALREAGPAHAPALRAALRRLLVPFLVDGTVEVPVVMNLFTARAPG